MLTVHRHPTGVAVRGPVGTATLELFWAQDRGVWLCGPVLDDGAVKYGPEPVALQAPACGPDGVDVADAERVAAGWFGVDEEEGT